MTRYYIIDENGIYIPYNGKVDKNNLNINEAYLIKGKIYIYRGEISNSNKNLDNIKNNKGFYLNIDTGKFLITKNSSYEKSSIISKEISLLEANKSQIEELKKNNSILVAKEEINNKGLTMNDIYNYDEKSGYNLFYGLSTRNTMTWKIFETWCDLLGYEPQIILKKVK